MKREMQGEFLDAERQLTHAKREPRRSYESFGYGSGEVGRGDDLARLKEFHLTYFRSMQALVADSSPSECVVLFNTQLFALDAHAHSHE